MPFVSDPFPNVFGCFALLVPVPFPIVLLFLFSTGDMCGTSLSRSHQFFASLQDPLQGVLGIDRFDDNSLGFVNGFDTNDRDS